MEKAEFDDYFKALEKSGDRARTVTYAFIIVYVAMLLYGLDAFAYPARQVVYDNVNLQIRCRYGDILDPQCSTVRDTVRAKEWPPQVVPDMEKALWQHELQLFYDDSVAARTFQLPVFGLATDRDLLWLLFPLIGIIGYYIVGLGISRVFEMFRLLLHRNCKSAFRIRLIQSTLMISTPLDTEKHGMDPLFQAIWRAITSLVFGIPVIVSMLIIADQTNAIAVLIRQLPGEKLTYNASYPAIAQLLAGGALLLVEVGLFVKLTRLGSAFGRLQAEATSTVRQLEDDTHERDRRPVDQSAADSSDLDPLRA